jgi:branched-chain amino acid transport system permease protein
MTAVPAGHFQVSYRGDLSRRKTAFQRGRLVALAVVLIGLPFVVGSFTLDVSSAILLAVPGALALSLLTGVAGQISLGNAAFMAIGGTTAGLLGGQLHWPFLLVLLSAAVMSGLVGVVVGVPSLRVRGLYLIIATLALQFVISYVVQRVQSSAVGPAGFLLPTAGVGPWAISTPTAWYFVLLTYAALVTMIHVNIVRTRIGRAWAVIRDRDIAAEIIGIPVARYKINAFVVTSVLIGVQGALLAYFLGLVTYDMFTLPVAISYVAMIIIGGLGSHVGAIYGASFVTALPYLLPKLLDHLPPALSSHLENYIFDVQTFLYGLLVVLFLLFEPRGIAEITRRARQYFVLWPFSKERLAEEEG